MKQKKKRKSIVIISIIAAIIVIFIVLYNTEKVQSHMFANAMHEVFLKKTYVSEFKKYKEDFEAVKDFAIKAEIKYHTSDREVYSIGIDYIDNKLDVFDCDALKTINLSKEMKTHFINIIKCVSDDYGEISTIAVVDKQIAFYIKDDYYALIYARDGKKPTGLGYSYDNDFDEFYIKNLGDNWYTVKGIM